MDNTSTNDQKSRPIREVTHHLRDWRDKRGLTADALGERAGLTGSFITQLEKGRSAYTQNSLEKLAEGLGVEPWQILGQDPNNPSKLIITTNFDAVLKELDEVNRARARTMRHTVECLFSEMVTKLARELFFKKQPDETLKE